MKKFKDHSLESYLGVLSAREPVPGGGSAAALAAALGAGLISMVTRYSLGKGAATAIEGKLQKILRRSESLRAQLLKLVDLDAEAYLGVVRARKGTAKAKKAAQKKAAAVPRLICKLCYQAIELTPFLVVKGNVWLLPDVEVAVELLTAAHQSAAALSRQE